MILKPLRFRPLTCLKTILFCLVILLTGCSQKIKDFNATAVEAYNGFSDIELTKEEIIAIPYASAYLRINDGRQIFIALTFAEENIETGNLQLKWITADGALIITEQGRVIKTFGLQKDNLVSISGISNSPQTPWITDLTSMQESLRYSWMPDYRFEIPAYSESKVSHKEVITTPLWTKETTVITEEVTFPTVSAEITNTYWLDSVGDVVKSIQYLGPNMHKLELTILKAYG